MKEDATIEDRFIFGYPEQEQDPDFDSLPKSFLEGLNLSLGLILALPASIYWRLKYRGNLGPDY